MSSWDLDFPTMLAITRVHYSWHATIAMAGSNALHWKRSVTYCVCHVHWSGWQVVAVVSFCCCGEFASKGQLGDGQVSVTTLAIEMADGYVRGAAMDATDKMASSSDTVAIFVLTLYGVL
jgi:hypothetical protein